MRRWQTWLLINIIHVAERAFAEDVFTPPGNLETMKRVRFAIPTETKQMKKRLRK